MPQPSMVGALKQELAANQRPVTLAILGLDSAGKTTTTKAFLGDTLDTAPTVGFNKEEFNFDHYSITLYDLGGGTKIRGIWKDYLHEIYGIIYVIDSSARERIDEVKNNVWNLIKHEKVQSKPVLVLANKEDIEGHMDEVEIMQTLQLEDLVNINKCPCKMVMCSAIKGTGKKMDGHLREGMSWLCSVLDQSYDKLRMRVAGDMEILEERRQKEKEERRERVRKQREERQRKEEEENKKLGIKKEDEEDEDDDDDIVDGANPFKRLDSEEIQRKEEKFHLEKEKEKERKKRLKEIEEQENTNPTYLSDNTPFTSNNTGFVSNTTAFVSNNTAFVSNNSLNSSRKEDAEDDGLHVPRSSRSLGSYGLFNGSLSHRKMAPASDDDPDSDANIPRLGRQLLPPLQSPIGTKFMEGTPNDNKDKKKKKKQKPKGSILDDSLEESKDNHVYGIDNYGQSTMSVSKIDVMSQMENDSDTSDKNVSGKDKYFKGSTVVAVDSGHKQKGKIDLTRMDNKDGFDTLRLSQHLDDNDDEGLGSGRSFSPGLKNSHISNEYSSGRSQTPVKKLKKKNKHLRKNKLAPSDDEHELSDITQSPKKEPLPWDKQQQPESQLEIVDALDDDITAGTEDQWGLAEDLAVTDGNQPVQRSRPNFDSEDLIL